MQYLDRLESWISFNKRVLNESLRMKNPIIERLTYLGITESNLDEKIKSGILPISSIKQHTTDIENHYISLLTELKTNHSVDIVNPHDLSISHPKEYKKLKHNFTENILPCLQPIIVRRSISRPFVSSDDTILVTRLHNENSGILSTVRIPNQLEHLIKIPGISKTYVRLPELIKEFSWMLYPGEKIAWQSLVRVLRKVESIRYDSTGELVLSKLKKDYVSSIKSELDDREKAGIVCIDIESSLPREEVKVIARELFDCDKTVVRQRNIPHSLNFLKKLPDNIKNIDDGSFEKHKKNIIPLEISSESIFTSIDKHDILVHHPYQSFRFTTIRFIEEASNDPNVVSIKQTLYRINQNSLIADALINAARLGKEVTVLMELKAKFDELNNVDWTQRFKKAGVNVIFGPIELKTHSKICIVSRISENGLKTYANISTGNYNEVTATQYEDLSLFTKSKSTVVELSKLFNHLGGFSRLEETKNIILSPYNTRKTIISKIDKCIESTGSIFIKCNALTDKEIIDKLYEASNAGCKITLIIRGMCCLVPGVKDLSENIRVVSVVGRYLEHSRLYYFSYLKGEDKVEDVIIGSADLMERNLDERIEVLTQIKSPQNVQYIKKIIDIYMNDVLTSYILNSDGSYSYPIDVPRDKSDMTVHETLYQHHKKKDKSRIMW